MWSFFETVRHRHSVRRYEPDMEVEQEKLHAILETATAAPSAGDLQAYRIFVVTDAVQRAALVEFSSRHEFITQAPVCMVFCADPQRSIATFGEESGRVFSMQDTTIVASYAQLAAVAAGLASAWVGSFESDGISECLQLPDGLEPVALITIGYPAELPELTPRRPLTEIVDYL
ncbi:MAG: nitroreductase family protein [Gammaproteobacteria bacterium]